MAATNYGVNDPLAVKLWSKKLSVEVLKETWIMQFAGTNSNSMVQIKDETQKGAGDKITYGLRMQLQAAGIQGDGTLEGNEESLVTYSDSILINQLRNAVRSAGRMSQQRVPFSVRDEALSGLRDWYADRFDTCGFNQLCGNTVQTNTSYTGNNATVAVDSSHQRWASTATTDQGLTSTQTFNLNLFDSAVEVCKTLTPAIRPVRTGGKEFYLGFLHPYQVTDMRINTSTGQWLDIQKAAMTGGEISDNPIFDGALGVYNGVIIHSDFRVPLGIQSAASTTAVANTRRAVVAGAQALMLGYGRDNGPGRYTWVEELFDYENELGVSVGCIFGMKKTIFNSMDFADVVLSTYAASH